MRRVCEIRDALLSLVVHDRVGCACSAKCVACLFPRYPPGLIHIRLAHCQWHSLSVGQTLPLSLALRLLRVAWAFVGISTLMVEINHSVPLFSRNPSNILLIINEGPPTPIPLPLPGVRVNLRPNYFLVLDKLEFGAGSGFYCELRRRKRATPL